MPLLVATLFWVTLKYAPTFRPKHSNWYLVFAVFLVQASLACFALRLRYSLRALGLQLAARDSALIAMQSLFYFFIPLSIGTEAARWIKIRGRIPDASKTSVLAAVFLDRAAAAVACVMIALATLPFVATISIDVHWPSDGLTTGVWVMVLIVIFIAAFRTILVLARKHDISTDRLWRSSFLGSMAASLTLALLTQVLMILAIWIGFQWLGAGMDPTGIALGVTGGALAQVVPLSAAGAGPGELTAGLLFVAAGASGEQAVLLGTMIYLCKLIGGIEGGLLEWWPIAGRILARRSTSRGT